MPRETRLAIPPALYFSGFSCYNLWSRKTLPRGVIGSTTGSGSVSWGSSPYGVIFRFRIADFRRGDRAAECAGLENRCTGNGTEGSNPSLSATKPWFSQGFRVSGQLLWLSCTSMHVHACTCCVVWCAALIPRKSSSESPESPRNLRFYRENMLFCSGGGRIRTRRVRIVVVLIARTGMSGMLASSFDTGCLGRNSLSLHPMIDRLASD